MLGRGPQPESMTYEEIFGTDKTYGPVNEGDVNYFHVASKNAGGVSDFSSPITMTQRLYTPPLATTGMSVTDGGSTLNLLWNPNTKATDGYIVQVQTIVSGVPSGFSDLPNMPIYENTHTDNTAKVENIYGKQYQYRVIAVNVAGNSPASNVASYTTPTPVIREPASGSSWVASGGGARYWRVQSGTARVIWDNVNQGNVGGTGTTQSGLIGGWRYYRSSEQDVQPVWIDYRVYRINQ